jgi:hypothetical protein
MKLNKIAFGIALAAGVTTQAAADDLFFPMVVNSDTVATLLSVANMVPGQAAYSDRALFVSLNYKQTEKLDEACKHLDGNLRSSTNDLMTVSLSSYFGNLMFGDPSGASKIVADTYQKIGAYRGYVVVSNRDYGYAGVDTTNALYGEAMVVDFSAGASWGYVGWNTQTNQAALPVVGLTGAVATATTTATNAGYLVNDYAYGIHSSAAAAGFGGGVIGTGGSVVTLMPSAQVTTKLFVTPVPATRQQLWDPQTNGQASVIVRLGPVGNNTMYDRDEVPRSFSTSTRVTCVGAVDVWKDLIPAALNNGETAWGAKGGFSDVRVAATPLAPATALTPADTVAEITASVMKLEFGTALDTKSAGAGTWNNAYQLLYPY